MKFTELEFVVTHEETSKVFLTRKEADIYGFSLLEEGKTFSMRIQLRGNFEKGIETGSMLKVSWGK